MCGINGYYLSQNTTDENIFLEKANHKLRHRGPNNQGVYLESNHLLGLGHTRLSIQDLSNHANQPMISSCKRYVIVFNGEIYNFKKIQKFLTNKNQNIIYRSKSDTEVVLNLFSFCNQENKSKQYFLSKLKGIFALAIWDIQKQELFIARDSFGVKPLYFVLMIKVSFFLAK